MRLHSPLFIVGLAVLLLGTLLTLVRSHGYLQFLELAAYDLLVAGVPTAGEEPVDIALVLVDETDIQALGNWPLNDLQLRDALAGILALDPEVVGLDIYRDLAVPPGNDALQTLLRDEARVIAIEKFPEGEARGIPAPPALRGTQRTGFSDLVADPGGVVRRSLLFQTGDERTGYAFSLRLALAYLAGRGIHPAPDAADSSQMRLGAVTFAPIDGDAGGYSAIDAGGYQVLLRYRNRPSPFPVYRLRELASDRLPARALADRVVILGVAAEGVKDYFATPFALLDPAAGTVAGSVVHAHAAQQLIDGALRARAPLQTWPAAAELGWLWAWIGLGFAAGWFAGPAWRFVAVTTAGAGLAVGLAVIAYRAGWWVPVVPNLLGWLLAASLSAAVLAAQRHREHRALMGMFSRHVSPQVADTIWRRRDQLLDDGRVVPRTFAVTTLFTDLQGFTAISDRLEPEPFLDWLNSYLAALTDVIMEHGGVLDDFAGDGIKASFGVPFCEPGETAEHARRAAECALALGATLTRLNRYWRQQGRDGVAMRVGIHTGEVVVGCVGSASRMKYTTVDRNVNLASRLECLKEFPCPDPDDEARNCRVLISERTAALVADVFEVVDMGLYDLRGITHKVRVFAMTGRKPEEDRHADD